MSLSPLTVVLADAAAENLYPGRMQMAVSLGWHIVFSCLGVAFPAIALFAEWRAHRTGDPPLHDLAHTWAKAMGVLFAAGARLRDPPHIRDGHPVARAHEHLRRDLRVPVRAGGLLVLHRGDLRRDLPVRLEPHVAPRATCSAPCPMILAGMAGTFFVVAANAWMNNPVGFKVAPTAHCTDVDPIAGMFAPSMPPQVVHMWIAAFMVTGFGIASVYAVGMLRGPARPLPPLRDAHPAHRRRDLRPDPDRRG
jgi:cytochrome d ubiquinol oxidase subunit I